VIDQVKTLFLKLRYYWVQILARLVVLFFGLLSSRWLISNFSPDEYKEYTIIADSVNTIILTIITIALPNIIHKFYTNQDFAEEHKQKFADFWTTITILRFVTYLVGLGLLVVFWYIDVIHSFDIAILLFTAQFILLADLNYRTVCDSLNRSWQYGLTDMISKGVLVILLYGFARFFLLDSVVYYYAFAAIGAYGLAVLIDFFWQHKYTPWGRFDVSIIRENLRSILFITGTNIITVTYLFSSQLFLDFFEIPAEDINAFSNAYNRTFLTLATIPTIITPNIASLFKKTYDKQGFQAARKYIVYTLGFGVIYTVAIMIGGPIVLKLIDPQDLYANSYGLFFIIGSVMIFYPFLFLMADIFVFFHKEKYQLFAGSTLAVFGIIFQVSLIPWLGVLGSALSFLGVMVLDLIIKIALFYRLRRQW
jgi:O-antigen/teichoic acid export membrane protein